MCWTRLSGFYVKKRISIRLRFGEPVRIRRLGGGVTHYWFAPGRVFAVLWWTRLSPRRQVACFAVAEALSAGGAGYRLPAIEPAVRVHAYLNCRCVGKDRGVVGRADTLIRSIERADIDPCQVPAAYYRAASQSLRVGREPRRLHAEDLYRFLRTHAYDN